MATIDEDDIGRSYTWYCTMCQERRHDVQTNHTALKHIEEYPEHVVVGTGMMMSVFRMSLIDQVQRGRHRRVHDVLLPDTVSPLPGESLE